MSKIVRVGTRDSLLALWQASQVKVELEKHKIKAEIIKIKSKGDSDLTKPLYEFGVSGIFTKTLDNALLNKKIDIAVHSLKDVPTKPARGVKIKCVLSRENPIDVLVLKDENINFNSALKIATSSIRRKCQWLYKYPNHNIVPIRGNIGSRLSKLKKNNWDGAIFAYAGLKRLGINKVKLKELNWMIPCAAQGTIGIAGLETVKEFDEILERINCPETYRLVGIERKFIGLLGGGCSKPISAHAQIRKNKIIFNTNVCSLDSKKSISDSAEFNINEEDIANKSYLKNCKLGVKDIINLY
ncbi:MAG: hydroxymethylbilane synthase [Flavobacteriales bacterium]|nr:hydroxymethylbilane synthase [Flavobacteriales bacterium]